MILNNRKLKVFSFVLFTILVLIKNVNIAKIYIYFWNEFTMFFFFSCYKINTTPHHDCIYSRTNYINVFGYDLCRHFPIEQDQCWNYWTESICRTCGLALYPRLQIFVAFFFYCPSELHQRSYFAGVWRQFVRTEARIDHWQRLL